MFIIPGELISYLTFPGVIVHELSHRVFCDIAGIPVHYINYFTGEKIAGYVIHKPTHSLYREFWVAIGPLIINTILCAALTLPYMSSDFMLGTTITTSFIIKIAYGILLWLGFSIGMHAFPSDHDMNNLSTVLKKTADKRPAVLHLPLWLFVHSLIGICIIANKLRFFWFDAFYAMGVAYVTPYLLFGVH